ncbi:MAG: hypothetical protein WCD53_27965 [Microcoleus sp.]
MGDFSTKTGFLANRQLKKPGFLPNLRVLMGDFSTKTRFLATSQLKKPGFLLNLPVATKYFDKNPVSGYPPTKATGFFTESAGDNQVFRKKTRFLATSQLKKPGFIPNLWVLMGDFRQKPGFWPPAN